MTITELGALGEFFGSIGVIATLIYLAVQIRQNSAAMRAQTRSQTSLYVDRLMERQVNNDALVRINVKRRNGEELTEEEEVRLEGQVRAVFRNAEHSFYQARVGTYDAGEFAGERRFFRRAFSDTRFRAFWSEYKDDFSDAFQTELEVLLNAPDDE